MRNQLLDIVRAVSVLPFEIVKVTANDGKVVLQSNIIDGDRETGVGSIIFRGTLKNEVSGFNGIFGLNNITMLSGLVNLEAFKSADAKITLKQLERNGVKIPEELVFEKDGFGKASYRLMAEKAVPAQMKQVTTLDWKVQITQPTQKKISELEQIASIYASQETSFSIKTENKQLVFLIGDENAATSRAKFVFAENVTGNIKPNHTWNLQGFLKVLKLGTKGDTTVKISEEGILQVEIDTGLGVYSYLFAGSN